MHSALRILVSIAVLTGTACGQQVTPTESKLVGDWSVPRGRVDDNGVIDTKSGFDITTLKADHTLSQTAHPTQAPPAHVLSGTWRLDGQKLVLKFTWAHPSMQDMVGEELRLVILDLQADKLVSANEQNQKQKLVWTRVK